MKKKQNGAILSLTNLSHDDIWPSGFQKMRVKYSSKIFSESVSSALIAYKQLSQEFKPCHATAILIMETAKWFKVVNNYHSDQAISSSNITLFEQFKNIVINFAHIIVSGKFVKTHFPEDFPENYKLPKSAIKPIQSSVAKSSSSLLIISSKIVQTDVTKMNNLKQNGFKTIEPRFFSSNVSQDCVESLFGQLRAEGCGNPTPLRVLQLLKFRILTFWNMCNKNCEFFSESDSENLLNNFNSFTRFVK